MSPRRSPRRSLLAALGALVVVAGLVGCQSFAASGGQRGGRQGALPKASSGPVVWSPVGVPSASRSPSPTPTSATPHGPVRPRQLPATRVPQVDGRKSRSKVVALTFDDGPGVDTARVVRVLQRERVPATFFVLGMNVVDRPDDVRLLTKAGMSVQSHTWDHKDLTRLSNRGIDSELRRTSRAIARVGGERPSCVRPPYGATDHRVQRRIAADGQVPVTWNVDTDDWMKPGTGTIVKRALATARPNAIVLMHDGGGTRDQTIAALPAIIHRLRARGYTFTALCQPGPGQGG